LADGVQLKISGADGLLQKAENPLPDEFLAARILA
jgi:hypothetical protein